MKLLIFSNTDGDFEYIDTLLEEYSDVDAGISLGDMYLYSKSTPIEYFLRSKFRHLSEKSIELNKKGFNFNKPIFGVYGELDDPFIPLNEFKINNLFLHWQLINNFLGHNENMTLTKKISIGFLGGYYNTRKFPKQNNRRNKMSRERQSLALCHNDFNLFNNNKLDILFTHDSPLGYPPNTAPISMTGLPTIEPPPFGCMAITDLIKRTKPSLILYGHHRSFYYERLDEKCDLPRTTMGIPPLNNGHAILDIYNRKITIRMIDQQDKEYVY
jgi:Icc-related predicted phosphoesterase